jgi:hypothetical protein
LIGQQNTIKQCAKEEYLITIKDFNDSDNQDTLYKEYQLIKAKTTTDLHFNIRKHWCKNLFECLIKRSIDDIGTRLKSSQIHLLLELNMHNTAINLYKKIMLHTG